MSISFTPKTWKDRQATNLGNRKLTDTSTNSSVYTEFTEAEGSVSEEPTKFNAANMSGHLNTDGVDGLETRVKAAFDELAAMVSSGNMLNLFFPVGSLYLSFNSTSPATLFGGTWKSLDGGLLMCGDNLPYDMRNNIQYTANYNNQSLIPQGSVTPSFSIQAANAGLPAHDHQYEDEYNWAHNNTRSTQIVYSTSTQDILAARDPIYSPVTINSGVAGNSSASHTHLYESGTVQSQLNSVPVNIEKPAVTMYCWVRMS